MANGVTVNQFVCLFPSGTRIKIHMIFADREKTERFNDEDFGVWGGGDYYGITRHSIGECTVHEARMLKPFIKNHRYDLDVWAFEPKYCENLEKTAERDAEGGKLIMYIGANDYSDYDPSFCDGHPCPRDCGSCPNVADNREEDEECTKN